MLNTTILLTAAILAQTNTSSLPARPMGPAAPTKAGVPAAPPALPAGPASPRALPDTAVIPRCIVTLINEVQLPAKVAAQLVDLGVIEGAMVTKGQLIGKQDDNEVKFKRDVSAIEREISKKQSENDVKVKAAKAAWDLAKAELEQGQTLALKNSIAPSELRRLQFANEKAQYEYEAAGVEQTIQKTVVTARDAQLASADDEIQRRQILSPINGVVEKISKRVGEWLNPGEVVMTLVELEQVRVEGYLNSNQFAPFEIIGKPVLVDVEMARGRIEKFDGVIGYTSARDDAAGEYRVWATIKNRQENGQWIVRAGQRAKMTVSLKP